MKKRCELAIAFLLLCGLGMPAQAELIDNGNGTITDTSTGLMWLKDANQAGTTMTWDEANAWAEGLDFAGFSDWRLPSGADPDGTVCNSRPAGANCTQTEFGGLYFGETITAFSPGLFTNVQAGSYWTSTEWPADPTHAMAQDFIDGGQNDFAKDTQFSAWAVRRVGRPVRIWWRGRWTIVFIVAMALVVLPISYYLARRSRRAARPPG